MSLLDEKEIIDRAELRDLEQSIEVVSDACVCVGCGCSNLNPCIAGCSWITWQDDRGICSQCVYLPIDELVRRSQISRIQVYTP